MNKQKLASTIWESANRMRAKIEAYEYKDYILGFMFYKFLSDQEMSYLKKSGYDDETLKGVNKDDTETSEFCKQNLGYFIPYENLFSTWMQERKNFSAQNVLNAIRSFGENIDYNQKRIFENIFVTLDTNFTKLGIESDSAKGNTTRGLDTTVWNLLSLIQSIPSGEKQNYDILGFVYEYLISNFAANAGKKAGEFYTPHEVSTLMAEIIANHLMDRGTISIYDPTSGSGSLLITIGKSVGKYIQNPQAIKYFAQEIKANTFNLTRMNLVMRNITPANIELRNEDTLKWDWPIVEDGDPLRVDAVVSNPPYSQEWEPDEVDRRFSFGVPPKSKADYAFLLHCLYHINEDGIMAIVLPHGVLFRGSSEEDIRKNLIDNNHIDTIIGLPPNIFFGTSIPTIIMVLKRNRENTDVLFIDASKRFEKKGKNNVLRACDIKKIADTVKFRISEPKFSRVVSQEEIRNNQCNLNIPRYVDSSEDTEELDIYALVCGGIPIRELNNLSIWWDKLPGLKEDLFEPIDASYVRLKKEDLSKAVLEHSSVQAFSQSFASHFSNFSEFLQKEFLDSNYQVDLTKEEDKLSDDIFERMAPVTLLDKYDAYQILHDHWIEIATDLEEIQTQEEGEDCIRKIDVDIELQDGMDGHILLFKLVQNVYLQEDLKKVQAIEDKIEAIDFELKELGEKVSEEDREKDFFNADKETFVATEVKKALKRLDIDRELINVLMDADKLFTKKKKIKKELDVAKEALRNNTVAVIKKLTDEQVKGILKMKWIDPLVSEICKLPETALQGFIGKIEGLKDKYKENLQEIEGEIQKTQEELFGMMHELTGSEEDMRGLRELERILKGGR